MDEDDGDEVVDYNISGTLMELVKMVDASLADSLPSWQLSGLVWDKSLLYIKPEHRP